MSHPFVTAKDGTKFDAESAEVKAELAKTPAITLQAALDNVVSTYNAK